MSPVRILLVLMVLLGTVFIFQMPEPAFGSGNSYLKLTRNDDNLLALNKAEYNTLSRLERKLKSEEKRLERLEKKICQQRKAT